MSIQKIEPTTKVKEWVNRMNQSFEEVRRREMCWSAVSKSGQSVYEFVIPNDDPEQDFKKFDVNGQYIVQYGGVVLDPRDYLLEGTKLTFVNGPCMEDDYAIVVKYVSGVKTTIRGREKEE